MQRMTRPKTREIVSDFAKEIRDKRRSTAKPSKTVINFRNEMAGGVERDVWLIPIDILRYRKDNGRIASDVLDYERTIGVLDEKDKNAQETIRKFLEGKDPERTAILMKNIRHDGQQQPAIVTCDGFLINGNRRKMVMEKLCNEAPNGDSFRCMKAVILPGEGDEGGPPSLLEIEAIENRYQLQSDGKAEYYRFDRALSIKRKVDLGYTLIDQLRDDPLYVAATKKQLDKAAKAIEAEFLKPLACVDRYLKQFRRQGLYRTISTGMSDSEGRWQAFFDYSNTFTRNFANPKRRVELDIEEDEIGVIEEAAFDIIRLRTIPDMPKVHGIMRDLHKYCRTREGKKAIKKIADGVEPILPKEERLDGNGRSLSTEEVDRKWATKNKQTIIYRVKQASRFHETLKEKETPMGLLDAAYKKLTHDDMDVKAIATSDYDKARKLAGQISEKALELDGKIYHCKKELKKLGRKRT